MNIENSENPLETPSAQMVALRKTNVDLSGLMSVLSQHLYSTPMVALRELVQNAHDSILRRRIEVPDWDGSSRIEVFGDAASKTLRVIDTGAGLTEAEIHAYLATVGVGYTRTLREAEDKAGGASSGLIGMFGLGFLSAFVLAKRVTVNTTSWQSPELGHCYSSSNAERYSVLEQKPRAVGTEIILELRDEYAHLTHPKRLQEILEHYCLLLKEPIYIGQSEQALNQEPPPWRRGRAAPRLLPAEEIRRNLAFAARFESNFEPLCTFPVSAKPGSEASDLCGMLWIQDGATYGTSDNRNLAVFLRGMLLDDDARNLLPSWAGFIGGAIESNSLTPTASREDLQRDAGYAATRHALTESLIDGLAHLAKHEPTIWRRVVMRHNEALLGASLCDERLFAAMMDTLHVPTSQGDLPVSQLIAKGALHVILDQRPGFEEMLFRALGVPVAFGNRFGVVPFLRRWVSERPVRLIELGTAQGNQQFFSLQTLAKDDADWLSEHLVGEEKLIAARFLPIELPFIVVADRDSELKRRLDEDEKDKKLSFAALRLARQFTANLDSNHSQHLYINLDNPAIIALLDARTTGNENAIKQAARLLRAFKTIMNSRNNSESTDTEERNKANNPLTSALADLADSVQFLLSQ